jgi:hypothetical protein
LIQICIDIKAFTHGSFHPLFRTGGTGGIGQDRVVGLSLHTGVNPASEHYGMIAGYPFVGIMSNCIIKVVRSPLVKIGPVSSWTKISS